MALDEKLAERVRGALAEANAAEVKMFGGVGFMLNGNLVACVSQRGLLVRVGEEGKPQALLAGATPMVMNGREMKGFVWVREELDARSVGSWLTKARAFVATLPTKKSVTKKSATKKSVTKKSTTKKSTTKKSTTKKSTTKKSTTKKSTTKKSTTKKSVRVKR